LADEGDPCGGDFLRSWAGDGGSCPQVGRVQFYPCPVLAAPHWGRVPPEFHAHGKRSGLAPWRTREGGM